MAESFAFAVLMGAAFPTALSFLLDRVGHVLDRRLDRSLDAEFPVTKELSEAQRVELRELRDRLSASVGRPWEEVRDDQELLRAMDRVRTILEYVHARQIDFAGEDRRPADFQIRSVIRVKELDGGALGVEVQQVRRPADISSQVEADRAAGRVTGVRIDTIE